MIRRLFLLTAFVALGACADPAERIAAPEVAASHDEDCRQNGSGNLDCPP